MPHGAVAAAVRCDDRAQGEECALAVGPGGDAARAGADATRASFVVPVAEGDVVALGVLEGFGGQRSGDLSCRAACEGMLEALAAPAPPDRGRRRAWLLDAAGRAHARLLRASAEGMVGYGGHVGPSSRGAAFALASVAGGAVDVVHGGHVRAYAFEGGALRCVTVDHTLREAYRDRGLDDAAREALPNVCVRCLGLGDGEFPVTSFEVARGGAVVLLSRGVHQALAEARLAAALTRERARGGDSSWAARAAAALVAEATDPSAWGDATALVLAR